MGCFSVENPHVRVWENLIKRSDVINTKISKSGKKFIKTPNESNKTQLKNALIERFESNRSLKERLLSYGFNANEIQDIFPDEKYSMENEKLKIENEKLRKQVAKINQYEAQLNQLKAQNNKLKLDNNNLKLIPKSTDDSLKDYALKIETLQNQLLEQQQTSFKKQQDLEHFGRILRDNNIPITKTHQDIENALSTRNAERDLTKPFKDDEKLLSMLQEKNKLIYSLQCEASYYKAELGKFKALCEGLQTKYNEQQVQLKQYNFKEAEFQMKQNGFGKVEETIGNKNREIQESKFQISSLQIQLSQQHQTCLEKEKELALLNRMLEDLNVQLETSLSEKKLSQETAAHLINQLHQQLSKSSEEREHYKFKYEELLSELSQQHQTCLEKEKELAVLNRMLEDLNVQLKTSLSEKKLSQETAAHLVNQLHQQLSKSSEEKEHYKFKYAELLSELQNQASGMQCQTGVTSQTESSKAKGVLKKIEQISKNIEEIAKQVEEFAGTQEDKVFLHLKELLIKNVLTLDNIESDGDTLIRNKRKEVIKRAYEISDYLVQKSPSAKLS